LPKIAKASPAHKYRGQKAQAQKYYSRTTKSRNDNISFQFDLLSPPK